MFVKYVQAGRQAVWHSSKEQKAAKPLPFAIIIIIIIILIIINKRVSCQEARCVLTKLQLKARSYPLLDLPDPSKTHTVGTLLYTAPRQPGPYCLHVPKHIRLTSGYFCKFEFGFKMTLKQCTCSAALTAADGWSPPPREGARRGPPGSRCVLAVCSVRTCAPVRYIIYYLY